MAEKKIDYTRYYKKFHSEGEAYLNQMVGFYKANFIPLIDAKKEHRVLDIGCGMGFLLEALKVQGFDKLEGIELDKGQADICIKRGLNVKHVEDSIGYLADKLEQFDRIILLDVLEHIPYGTQLEFLNKICKSLKPAGKLILTVPNANSTLATRWRFNDWTHHISFTEHSLDFVLYNSGFQQIEIKETEFFSKPSPRLFFTRYILKKDYRKRLKHWLLFKFFRKVQRLKYIAELGPEQGASIPLSLNLLAIAAK